MFFESGATSQDYHKKVIAVSPFKTPASEKRFGVGHLARQKIPPKKSETTTILQALKFAGMNACN